MQENNYFGLVLLCLRRWHPKIALRYLPIVDDINRLDRTGSVLEVGSGTLGIAPYLQREITGVDIDFSGPNFPLVKKIRADASQLPFKDQSFDFVLAVDVLEHLPSPKRVSAIGEAFRVAKIAVYIAVPCGRKAEKQDNYLDNKYKSIYGKSHPFLTEHVKYKLPRDQEMVSIIRTCAQNLKRNIEITINGNINLTVRKFLMLGWMTKNQFVDLLFRKVFLLFIPILRLCNWEPTYRKIFFVYFKK